MKSANLKVPTVFHHKGTGQDAVCLRGPDGKRRMVYLGSHGSAEAQRRLREVLAEHLAGKPLSTARATRQAAASSSWPTVAQLCAAYLLHAERFYRDEQGHPTGEVTHATIAFRLLLELYRDTPTDRVTIRDLLNVRQALVDLREKHEHGRQAPSGLSRRTINDRMARIKRLFRWGVEQGTVPGSTWHELSALRGLPKGRCGVHDNAPIEAVPWGLVQDVLPHLVPTIADAVRLQWWSGVRPAEALAMTRRQLSQRAHSGVVRCCRECDAGRYASAAPWPSGKNPNRCPSRVDTTTGKTRCRCQPCSSQCSVPARARSIGSTASRGTVSTSSPWGGCWPVSLAKNSRMAGASGESGSVIMPASFVCGSCCNGAVWGRWLIYALPLHYAAPLSHTWGTAFRWRERRR